jgi:hypothetical protein
LQSNLAETVSLGNDIRHLPPTKPTPLSAGPVIVPLYLLLGSFGNTAAVALSNCTILASSLACTLLVVPRRRCDVCLWW